MLNASLFLLLGLGADPVKPAESLQGDWRIAAVEGGGPAKLLTGNVERILIDATKITAGRAADYTIDAAKKTIDMTLAGGPKAEQGKYLGVYELKDGELKLHFALPGKERLSGFKATESSFVVTLKKK